MARKIDIRTAQVEFDFPQAAAPPKPKDGRNGRKQLMSRRESASILGIKYHEDGEHDD
jgi:hypothetical protein